MSFGTLPPEINSARMHFGPGSASMLSAAKTWDEIADRLCDVAAGYSAVISALTTKARMDPAAVTVSLSATSHVGWLNAIAAQAQQTAAQVRVAIDAFESAFAATVPPTAIDANHRRRISLITTNGLAQNSPAIAGAEMDYQQMWVQDAEAMYNYAAASAAALTMPPFSSPPPAAVELADQGAAVARKSGRRSLISAPQIVSAGCQLMPVIPKALKAFSLSSTTTLDACLSSVASPLSKLSSLCGATDFAIAHLSSLNKASALNTAAAMMSLVSQPGGARLPWVARVGGCTSMGSLSVPKSWTKAANPSPVTPEALDEECIVIEPSDLIW
jgi:PPE-repeat protein